MMLVSTVLGYRYLLQEVKKGWQEKTSGSETEVLVFVEGGSGDQKRRFLQFSIWKVNVGDRQ
jgi:hypothetical protein